MRLHIGEGKNINLEIPLSIGGAEIAGPHPVSLPEPTSEPSPERERGDKIKRTLKNLVYRVNKVELGEETKFERGTLTVREAAVREALKEDELCRGLSIDIINPGAMNVFTNSMMDVIPIATKLEGKLGEGVTYEALGAVVLLTGVDEAGLQVADANSSDGILKERVMFGRPGCPDEGDIIIRMHAVVKDGMRMERPGPYAAHKAADYVIQEIRDALKKVPREEAEAERLYLDKESPGKPKVLIVKEIMGQGAMHDNLILPVEPAGVFGGKPNVDLGNLPVLLTPNEVRDGGVRALTCITPSTKENSRHYWREPLVELAAEDEELDLIGVVFIGSPQANTDKFYVSERLGRLVEALKVDGAIVTTEGFGNNHVDFGSHIEQIGMLGVPVVGVSYCGVQGALVTGNKYMDAMVDCSVSKDGVESDILGENTITPEVALRAVAMLKNKMMGEPILKAGKWDIEVQENNYELAKKSHGV